MVPVPVQIGLDARDGVKLGGVVFTVTLTLVALLVQFLLSVTDALYVTTVPDALKGGVALLELLSVELLLNPPLAEGEAVQE